MYCHVHHSLCSLRASRKMFPQHSRLETVARQQLKEKRLREAVADENDASQTVANKRRMILRAAFRLEQGARLLRSNLNRNFFILDGFVQKHHKDRSYRVLSGERAMPEVWRGRESKDRKHLARGSASDGGGPTKRATSIRLHRLGHQRERWSVLEENQREVPQRGAVRVLQVAGAQHIRWLF